VIQPTCATATGTITITTPVGAGLTYSIDGVNFQSSPVFPGLSPNSYTLTVQVTGGCIATSTATVNNVPNAPAAPGVSTPINYCQGATTVPLTATGTGILWYTTPTGGTGSSTAPVPSTGTPGTTTYYVSQTVGGCESIRSLIDVIVTSLVVAPITGNNFICVRGNSSSLLQSSPVGGTWASSVPNVAVVDANGNVTGVSAGITEITYTVNAGGCTSTVSTTINVGDLNLTLTATPNPVTSGGSIALNTSSSSAYQITAWLPSPLFSNQTATAQSITVDNDAVYYAVGQTPDGCIDTAQISVTVSKKNEDVFVPNVFTPNGDGKNDLLLVYGNTIDKIDFRVFNQWGQSIFETSDKSKGWDGRYKGLMQPVTVYVYALKATLLDGRVITKKGSITLIR
jgi:gliding motility-associated-like protein